MPYELAKVFRAEAGRVLASLLVQCRDIELAEDALQDACVQASEKWAQNGIPTKPAAWLLTVSRRRLIDSLRKSKRQHDQLVVSAVHGALGDNAELEEGGKEARQNIPDERLKLIFTCCHPAINQSARVALTLKTLCGLSISEIARAYLVSEAAMSKRITRAKRKIRDAGIAYQIPDKASLPNRLPSVLAVVYLIYNESYTAYEGQSLSRQDLTNEAIRLARLLLKLLPRPEVAGLLALILFHHARNGARISADKNYVPLEFQNRELWDKQQIAEAKKILLAGMMAGKADKYRVQAAISALHCEANTWADTDWVQIELLYKLLYKMDPSPVIALNHSIALANLGELEQAVTRMQDLSTTLADYQPYHAARADLQTKLGDTQKAERSYKMAISLSRNAIEEQYLQTRLNLLHAKPD